MAKQILPLIVPKAEKRFWNKVDKRDNDECWPWLASCSTPGYGQIKIGGVHLAAHRVAWVLTHRREVPVMPGYHGGCILHTCDNRKCCNPAHLFVGTNQENISDKAAKGRSAKVSLAGESNPNARLTDFQVREIRDIYAEGGQTLTELARQFGVTRTHIGDIIRGKRRIDAGKLKG